jgi:hypothetical protein
MQKTVNEILAYVCSDQPHALAGPLAEWLLASSRFRAFVSTYRDKIRKKIRGARDDEGLRDLLLELEIAYTLLQEQRFTVEYEKYGLGKARSPDFVVAFKVSVLFNLEVTRLRATDNGAEERLLDKRFASSRLSDIVCGKLGQMLPGMINILLVAPDIDQLTSADVQMAMAELKARAERKDAQFFARKGFRDAPEFFKQFHQLSGIILRGASSREAGTRPSLWANAQAKHPIPPNLRALLQK